MQNNLGAKLRAVREARKLSLRSVAATVGVSPSLLSQVETGKTQPSVSTLYSLVNHLGASIDDLLAPHADPQVAAVKPNITRLSSASRPSPSNDVIQRAADNPVIEMENGVQWERLAIGRSSLADPLITTYAPGGSSSVEGRFMRHSGVEYGYLLSGELTLKIDFETHVLRAGDSLCFDSSRPHLYVNDTDLEAKGLWFVVGRRDLTQYPSSDAQAPVRAGRAVHSAVDVLDAMDHFGRGNVGDIRVH
ncbi:MAG: cupin domain-containing protein [Microbacteriaceae bacterium]